MDPKKTLSKLVQSHPIFVIGPLLVAAFSAGFSVYGGIRQASGNEGVLSFSQQSKNEFNKELLAFATEYSDVNFIINNGAFETFANRVKREKGEAKLAYLTARVRELRQESAYASFFKRFGVDVYSKK